MVSDSPQCRANAEKIMEEYYAILGVHRWANEAEIKSAFRRLARRYHPDVSAEAGAEENFKRVNEAYNVLSALRKHDVPMAQPTAAGTDEDTGHHYREIVSAPYFRAFLALALPRGRTQYGAAQPSIKLNLPLESVHGGGVIRVGQPHACVDIHVPKGIRPGEVIRIEDFGTGAHVRFRVEYEPHPVYRVEADVIVVDVEVDSLQVERCEEVLVPTLGGEVRMKLPANATDGTRLRLQGRGLLSGDTYGDQIVCLKVVARVGSDARQKAQRWTASNDPLYRMASTGPRDAGPG